MDHEPVDRAPCVGIFRGRGPAEDRPDLYVLGEGTTPAGEQFAAHVISAAGQAWAAVDMSLTGSLTRLYAEAERNLLDWNSKSIAQHRVSLGLGAVARRGNQVVLAQAGPSLAFHLKSGSARIYAPEGDQARALGSTDQPVTPQLRGLVVEPGDRILLISTGALALADQDLIGAILSLPTEQVLRDLYQRVREARSISVLLLTMPDASKPHQGAGEDDLGHEPAAEAPADDEFVIGLDTPPPSGPYQPRLFLALGANGAGSPSGARRLEPRSIIERLPKLEQRPLDPLRRAAGDPAFNSLNGPRFGSLGEGYRSNGNLPDGQRQAQTGATGGLDARRTGARESQSFYRDLRPLDGLPPRPEPALSEAPPVEMLARARREQATFGVAPTESAASEPGLMAHSQIPVVRPRNAMGGGRWRGGGSLGSGTRQTSYKWRPPSLLMAILLLGTVIAVAVFLLPSQFQESADERYTRLVEEAGRSVASAQAEPDPGAKRKLLTIAQSALLEARDIRGSESEVVRLSEDVTAALAKMDSIVSPASVETVASLKEFGDQPLAVSRLAVGDGVVYLLDPTDGVVVAVSTNGADKNVVFEAGSQKGSPVPIAISAFEPPGGKRIVLLLDSKDQLWTLGLSGAPTPVAFAAPQGLSVTDISVSGSSLYILDAAATTVYRFEWANGGFTAPPAKMLTHNDLKAARYLLVSNAIVTMDADGSVRRFDGSIALRLSQAGIDSPLASAEPPQATADAGDVAILDPARDRVVVLSSDGTFIRQYRHNDFAQVTALVISEEGSFVFSGGTLRRVVWP